MMMIRTWKIMRTITSAGLSHSNIVRRERSLKTTVSKK
jgi:hypothetical protein